jgi:ribosome-binding factor A
VSQDRDRIKVIVAEMLERRIKDPRLGFVTVTDVRVTATPSNATIFYTVLGEDESIASTAAALESAKGLIRSEVAKQFGMRHVADAGRSSDRCPSRRGDRRTVGEGPRPSDDEPSAHRETNAYAGDEDPYKKPREQADDERRPRRSRDER